MEYQKLRIVIHTVNVNQNSVKVSQCHHLEIRNSGTLELSYQTASGRRTLAAGASHIYPVPSGMEIQDDITFQGQTQAEVITLVR